jgi:serine phosphatase RsbU (regulator of sigma subunit)
VISYIKIREKKLKQEKAILEQKVAERTAEVVHQKEIIEEKNKDITDSITYAQGIQQAILPPDDKFKKYLPDSFILFRPRDIVSGDFYWMEVATEALNNGRNDQGKDRQLVLFAVCDCTGHGVPGGFVSMVGNNGLTRTVNEHGIIHPASILDKAAVMVEETFRVGKRKDGMDVVLCGICSEDGSNYELEFAAANNPLYFVRKKQHGPLVENGQALEPDVETDTHWLFQINADKQPVGAYEYRKPFTNHLFRLLPGDTIYLSSDGFRDQFGGQKGKKFMAKNLKQILVSIQDKKMEEQKELLNKTIADWMAGYGQNDDICVMGVRV